MKRITVNPEQPYKNRRRAVAATMGVLAAFGAYSASKSAIGGIENRAQNGGHEFTQHQLAASPQVQVRVNQGEGVEAVVIGVDPKLANDPQGLADVESYVQKEGTGPAHMLEAGQTVGVPTGKNGK